MSQLCAHYAATLSLNRLGQQYMGGRSALYALTMRPLCAHYMFKLLIESMGPRRAHYPGIYQCSYAAMQHAAIRSISDVTWPNENDLLGSDARRFTYAPTTKTFVSNSVLCWASRAFCGYFSYFSWCIFWNYLWAQTGRPTGACVF